MICPKCAERKRYSYEAKHGGYNPTCSACGYEFILTPNISGVSDRWILKVLNLVSSGNTSYFTEEQFINQALSRKKRLRGYNLVSLIFAIGFLSCFLLMIKVGPYKTPNESENIARWVGLIIISAVPLFFGLVILFGGGFREGKSMALVSTLRKYIQARPHPFLLTSNVAEKLMNKLDESVLQDFHPDKVLIVDDLDYAILLLLNDFHRNENCLVLTESKRPRNSFKYFKERQANGEDLPIYLLHDFEPEADWSIENVTSDTQWGLKPEQITDLGLNEEDLMNCKTGIWYDPDTDDVQVHVKRKSYIDDKIEDGWIFPIDALPFNKIQPALSFCMEHRCSLLSPVALAAMPAIIGSGIDGSSSSGSTDFDDFG